MSSSPLLLGLGDPVLDVCVQVSHDLLKQLQVTPGGSSVVGPTEMHAYYREAVAHAPPIKVPGGSAANVMKGLAGISGGSLRACFVGMVGSDETGAAYAEQLRRHGVEPALLASTSTAPTARCLCLVTPDGQRTMRTCLGAAAELTACSQLEPLWAAPALLHCEGYLLFKPALARGAMAAAKRGGALVTLDLASFEVVRACRATLMAVLREGLVDVVFANEDEAAALLEEEEVQQQQQHDESEATKAARVEAAQALVLQHARCCVVSLGARGAVARASDGERGSAPACKVLVVDTIGAGDLFSSGFLYAYLHGAALSTCCAAGCAAGAEAVQTRGAALSPDAWARLRTAIAGLVAVAPGACCGSNSGGGARAGAIRRCRSVVCKACNARSLPMAASLGGGSSLGSSASQQWLFDPSDMQ